MGQRAQKYVHYFLQACGLPYWVEFSRRLSQAEYDYVAEAVRDGRWDEVQVYSKPVEASVR